MIKEQIACKNITNCTGKQVDKLSKMYGFDWIDPDVTKDHFPGRFRDTPFARRVLIRLNRSVLTSEVLDALKQQRVRAMSAAELLTVSASFGDLEDGRLVAVGLGEAWTDRLRHRHFLCLIKDQHRVGVGLAWENSIWSSDCYFAGIAIR